MKKCYLALILSMMSFIGFTQTTAYSIYVDSILGCETTLGVHLTIGSLPETAGVISVDWGDGNTSTHNYSTTAGNVTEYVLASHNYSLTGNYTASFNVYSGTSGANVDAGQNVNFMAYGASECGYIWISTVTSTSPNTPSISYTNVPYQFTDVNGNISIITPPPGFGTNVYAGLNIANVPYTVQIDPNWLTTNDLVQTSPNFTISSFDPGGMASNGWSEIVTVNCATQSPNPDFGISYGWAPNFVAAQQTGQLILEICNYACLDTSDVSVSVEMPANFVPNTSNLSNAVVSGNTLIFDLLSLTGCMQFYIPFTFPGNTPAGTSICFNLALSNPNDSDLSNNADTVCGVVLNSYDPNDKSVNLPEHINPNTTDQLQYMIRFQNDGNYPAANVVIKDSISPNLDLSTFRYTGAKHGVSTSIDVDTRIVTFSFYNINLAPSSVDMDASQGFIVYTISEMPNLPVGTEIENTAYIYFDFNPAIVTNTTYNINELPLGLSENKTEQIVFYPNPAQNKLHFSGSSVKKVSIYDLTGKLVLEEQHIVNNELSLNSIQTGIYQVVLQTNNNISTQKLVIQK